MNDHWFGECPVCGNDMYGDINSDSGICYNCTGNPGDTGEEAEDMKKRYEILYHSKETAVEHTAFISALTEDDAIEQFLRLYDMSTANIDKIKEVW